MPRRPLDQISGNPHNFLLKMIIDQGCDSKVRASNFQFDPSCGPSHVLYNQTTGEAAGVIAHLENSNNVKFMINCFLSNKVPISNKYDRESIAQSPIGRRRRFFAVSSSNGR